MKLGDIVIVDFPFSNSVQTKIRPVVVVTTTDDKYKDFVLCLISSVVPATPTATEILLQPNKIDNLRSSSVIKVYRVATLRPDKIIAKIGRLTINEVQIFTTPFQSLVTSR